MKQTEFDIYSIAAELAQKEKISATEATKILKARGYYPCVVCGAYRTIKRCEICKEIARDENVRT